MSAINDTSTTAQLWEKIEHVRVGMLTTIGAENKLESRPMTSQEVDKDGLLWFFVSDEAAVTKQIERNAAVNVSFADPADSLYVSTSGAAEIVHDRELIKSKWNPMVAAWFPGGAEDPHVALIKVRLSSAEYWDSDKSKMTQLFLMAKAAVTGTPPKMGEHKTVQL